MATKVGSAYFDVTFNTTAARREMTALVSVANRQFGLLGGVALVGATVAIGAAVQATVQLGQAALGMANEYEHAFARVRKTLDDGTLSAEDSQRAFGRLNQELRDMALDIPLDLSTEIAEIAALGGQMGIQMDQIEEFTQVIGELGVTTTLSVDEAATQFARLSNIVGLPASQFRSMADDLVHLGNNFAATEDEILRFSLRIAAAGEIVGFSESDILGLASAMTAVGVPAERGGTAIQRTLIRIQKAVSSGSGHLQTFGLVSGKTAGQFVADWREDPARAFQQFIEGVGASGDAAFKILQDTDLANERTIQSLLSLANAGGLYGRALDTVAESSGAAAREAEIFFNTTTSKLILLGNTAKDAGITMGEGLQQPTRDLIDMGIEWIGSNEVLIEQIGEDLGAALEGITPLILSVVDAIGTATASWADFVAGLGERPEPHIPAATEEFQAFFERGPFADPHLAKFFDTVLPGATGLATQLTISEDMLRRMVKHGGELSGHRISSGFNQEGILEEMTTVEMLAAALIDLDERWADFGGLAADRWGFDELLNEVELTDEQIREVFSLLREEGVVIPVSVLLEFGTQRTSARQPRRRVGTDPGMVAQVTNEIMLQRQLAEQEAMEEAAEAALEYEESLAALGEAAVDLGVPLTVLIANVHRLAPEMVGFVDANNDGVLASELFAQALSDLQNSIDFDLGNVTDQFDLLITKTNKAGDEVPQTAAQMIADLQKQADTLADFEAGVAVLELFNLDDLAAEFRTMDPKTALPALTEFVNDLEAAAEAEGILDLGGSVSDGMMESLQKALEEGDITTELVTLAKQFTSNEVKSEVATQAEALSALFQGALTDHLTLMDDIYIPVYLVPEFLTPIPGVPWTEPIQPESGDGGARRPPTSGGGGGVTVNLYSQGIRTGDAARAGNLINSLVAID